MGVMPCRRVCPKMFQKKAESERRHFRCIGERFGVLNDVVDLDEHVLMRFFGLLASASSAGASAVSDGEAVARRFRLDAGIHSGNGNRPVGEAHADGRRVADKGQQKRKAENYFLE